MSARKTTITAATFTFVSILLMVPIFASANPDEVCAQAADKIEIVIDDWYAFVKEYNAESKNASVIAMHKDVKAGVFRDKFIKDCANGWSLHGEVYSCFSGVRTEIGAAMCTHPDVNKNNWKYLFNPNSKP
jgi:hypothetical protein